MVPQSRFLVNTIRKDSEYQRFLNQLPLSILMFGASTALFVDMIVADRFASFLGCLLALLGTVCVSYQQGSSLIFSSVQRWGRKYKLNIALLVFSLIGAVYLLDYASAPAAAQFFTQTEGWMRNSFPINGGGGGGGADIYALVFNTLRAIFVLYLAISLVRVIAAARNDEDWQTLARTPLIILITVTLGDILAGLITGGGAGGAA